MPPLTSKPSQPNDITLTQPIRPQSKATELPTPKDNFIFALKILTHNVRGLCKSQCDVEQIIAEHNPDVMVLTKSKLADKNHHPWLDKLLNSNGGPHRTEVVALLSALSLTLPLPLNAPC